MTNPRSRFLSKSRFKLGMECPAKLFYTGKKDVYVNEKLEDSFLAALAEGGFQVGELAKAYFPGGHEVETLDSEAALAQTSKLLEQENVTLYEAAIRWKNLFIRADILVKKGGRLDLVEVKAKSYDPEKDGGFIGKRGGIDSGWKPYLLDVAFQKHVLSQAFPEYEVHASLMLADKTALCPTDGLHQKFRIVKDEKGRKKAERQEELTYEEREGRILCQINVDEIYDLIQQENLDLTVGPGRFVERIAWMAEHYGRDEKIRCRPATICGGCEFRATAEDEAKGMKSGFKECWQQALNWTDKDFETPNVLDIWNYLGKARLLAENRVAMADVTKGDIGPKPDGRPGHSASERQWLQVEKVQTADDSVWVDQSGLKQAMAQWKFPLHFIDFETTSVAIPFNRDRYPYELVAFQFSHHMVHQDGGVEHKGEYINTERGMFPNYDFVRALKKALEGDDGSIFRYGIHENSTLVAIDRQLTEDSQPPRDRDELKRFIRSITTSTKSGAEKWQGERTMIDLCEMVKRYCYAPATNGSNSIKAVLPAVLNHSTYLKEKYSRPVYGGGGEIPSLNFKDWKWIKMRDGKVVDPYTLLPKMFADGTGNDLERLNESDELRDGGSAMTAYARMQYEEMSEEEQKELRTALLCYCELDTLAMVMIYEAWKDLMK